MIFLDANVFLRALIPPASESGQEMHHQAADLLRAAGRGEQSITATHVVVHEVLYVLTSSSSKNGYEMSPADACDRMREIIVLSGFNLPQKPAVLAALELWKDHPELGFSDALTATMARQQGLKVFTFDTHFDHIEELDRFRPAA